MFPTPSRDNKLLMFNPSSSPSDRNQANRSTQLPYFKRFPNSKFLSQERKRIQKYDLRELSQQLTSPQSRPVNKPHFFSREKIKNSDTSPKKHQQEKGTSSILKPGRESKKRRLFKQSGEKQEKQGLKMRHNTDLTQQPRKGSIQPSRNHLKTQPQSKLTPIELLRIPNNLKPYQKEQLMSYSQIYYFGQNCIQKKDSLLELTKSDGAYNWLKGDQVHFRYEFIGILGEGSFGEVFKVLDHKRSKQVALKIVKNNEKYTKQARTEIKILNFLKSKDPHGTKNCVHIRDFFMFRDRMCMTFDLMSYNLYQLIKNNGYYGLPLDLIRRMALQILNAIHFLHKNQLIHADLKPQNILLKQANKSGVKVIDFGSSCFEKETIYTYIQSRYYRGPQVILGLPYNRKIDIWSFGCIIAQLHLGYPLFGGDQEHEQICFLIQVLGMPPLIMAQAAKRWEVFFDKNNHIKPHPKKAAPASKTLEASLENPEDPQFIQFIKMCLQWNPDRRCEALDLLKHEWIIKGLPEQIKQQHLKYVQDEEERRNHEGFKKNRTYSLNHQRHKLFS